MSIEMTDAKPTPTDFEIALSRLTAWVRDYGDMARDHGNARSKVFIADISYLLLSAKESMRQQKTIDELADMVRELRDDICSLPDSDYARSQIDKADALLKRIGMEAGK